MKKGLSEIVCIIDRSGSMSSVVNDAIGGFNTFLKDQQDASGEATLTYVQFDNHYEVVHENKPIQKVKPIDHSTYIPRGSTALLDAVGRTIDTVGTRLANTPEKDRPEKVIFAILTDGEENSSSKYTLAQVKSLITHQKDVYQWEFIFLGADQDAFAEGFKLGIAMKDIHVWDKKYTTQAYNKMSAETVAYRAS